MSAQIAASLCGLLLSLTLAPLLPGIINRAKAIMGGRRGRPLLQLYFDLAKLMRKAPVYPHVSSLFFRLPGPAGIASGVLALMVLPFGSLGAVLSFPGDFILLAGVFVLARFCLMLAALDTGSAFEGMGTAREALFSALAEPIFLFCLLALAYYMREFSLIDMFAGGLTPLSSRVDWAFYLMLICALFLLLLSENSRIPVDDPSTHLELTMIHEVMILDHSGPDLALLEYAAALKLWIFSLLIAGVLLPVNTDYPVLTSVGLHLLVIFCIAVLVGLVESLMARFRMERVPQVFTVAGALVCLAALAVWR
jgi:formate hydrogenlyase subunit 4